MGGNAFTAKPYFSIVQLANNSNDVCFVSVNQKASTFIRNHFAIEGRVAVAAGWGSAWQRLVEMGRECDPKRSKSRRRPKWGLSGEEEKSRQQKKKNESKILLHLNEFVCHLLYSFFVCFRVSSSSLFFWFCSSALSFLFHT